MKRPAADVGPSGGGGTPTVCPLTKKLPNVLMYLSDGKYDDGQPRELSTISVFVEDGRWKLALNDRDLKRSAYVTADTLQGAFEALEAGILRETLDWRNWGKSTKKK